MHTFWSRGSPGDRDFTSSLVALALACLCSGCYLVHERGADAAVMRDARATPDAALRSDAGVCTSPAPYRPPTSLGEGAPRLRSQHPSVAASAFRFVASPTGFLAAVDENEGDTAVLATTLLGFDRDGTVLFRRAFDEPITGPIVADDGTIWIGRRGGTLVSLDAAGDITGEHLIADLHSALWLSAMDARGRLVVTMPDYPSGSGIVLGFDPCAGEVWRLGLAGVPIGAPAEDLAGRLFFATDEHVYVVGADGSWQGTIAIGAFINGHPLVLASGEVAVTSVVGTGIDDAGSSTRVTLVDGTSTRTFDVPGRWHPGRSPLAETGDGGLLIRGWTDVALVELATGDTRWRAFAHPNILFDASGEPGGDLLVMSQSLSLLDARTGEPRWTFDAGVGTVCVDGVAIDRGTLAASQCDGTYLVAGW